MKENQPNNINDNVPKSDQGRHLPQYILEEILVRLPAKSLVQFKSVCKEWSNIIAILDHPELNFLRCLSMVGIFYQIKKRLRGPYEYCSIADECCSFKLDEKDRGTVAEEKARLHLQNVNSMREFQIKVACKSLLLFEGRPPGTSRNFTKLYVRGFTKLYVCDTISRWQKQLPEIVGFDGKRRFYTMVFDASKRTYLVVVFVNDEIGIGGMKLLLYALNPPQGEGEGDGDGDGEGEGEGNGGWRMSKPPLAQLIRWQQHSSVDVQGVLYWIAQPPSVDNCFIQPMVIATEEFREKIEPPCQSHRITDFYQLLEVRGSLGLLTVKDMARDELYIWVLKDLAESFWIKQHTIAHSSIECKARLSEPPLERRGFTHRQDFHPRLIVGSYMLVTMGPYDDLFWYNLDTKELREVHIRTHPPFTYYPSRRRGTFSIIG